jgi:hypothetical protein
VYARMCTLQCIRSNVCSPVYTLQVCSLSCAHSLCVSVSVPSVAGTVFSSPSVCPITHAAISPAVSALAGRAPRPATTPAPNQPPRAPPCPFPLSFPLYSTRQVGRRPGAPAPQPRWQVQTRRWSGWARMPLHFYPLSLFPECQCECQFISHFQCCAGNEDCLLRNVECNLNVNSPFCCRTRSCFVCLRVCIHSVLNLKLKTQTQSQSQTQSQRSNSM